MPLDQIGTGLSILLALVTLGGVAVGWVRWVQPRYRRGAQKRRDRDVVLLGRPPIPPNLVTGEPAQPEVLPLGRRLDLIFELLEQQAQLVGEMHHELHPNGGESMKDALTRVDERVQRIDEQVSGELATATDALANAAEASKTAIETIHSAILADPPADLT